MEDLMPVEHEEEIAVLKSIFNEDFIIVDDAGQLYTFDVIIRFDSLEKKILLIYEKSVELSHLPPMTLRVSYRRTYPEIDPPVYCILCDYLPADRLFGLVNQMDQMWNPGEVIVYTWIEFLKGSLNNELVLSTSECTRDDQRFVTKYDQIGARRIFEQLIEYNRIQNQIEFEQTNQMCPICLEDKSGKLFLKFEKCYHYACLPCLNSYAQESLLNIQQKKQIDCFQCQTMLHLSELRQIFSNENLFLKYQQHLIDMIWCPRCRQSIICIPSESQSGNHPSFVECLSCEFKFCRRCEEVWHPQIQCPKEKLLENLENLEENSSQYNPIQLKKLLAEIQCIQTIEQLSKPCPQCHVRIEKNGGCQHMNCRACQIHFCWTCGWYGPAYTTHPCEQKREKVEVVSADYTEERDLYDENGQKLKKDVAKRVQLCPRTDCRHVNIKMGTKNMIFCEKCGKEFCFLCGEPVYGLFHYSEYGCKLQTYI